MSFAAAIITALLFKGRFGSNEPLVLELPPYRFPTTRQMLNRAWAEVRHFWFWARRFIIFGVIAVWLLNNLPLVEEPASSLSLSVRLGTLLAPVLDQIGINPMLVFRRHFALDDARDWSWYVDIGIGVMLSADDIPQDGTSFNFTPRAGTGLTYQVSDDWRLIAGFRWSHISNARIFGDDDNPSSDGVMFSIGLSTSWDRLFN
jgi:hypothetical protein